VPWAGAVVGNEVSAAFMLMVANGRPSIESAARNPPVRHDGVDLPR